METGTSALSERATIKDRPQISRESGEQGFDKHESLWERRDGGVGEGRRGLSAKTLSSPSPHFNPSSPTPKRQGRRRGRGNRRVRRHRSWCIPAARPSGNSGIKAERAGAAASGFSFAGTTGQRAPQTRGHGQAGHQREQDGLRTNPAAPEPFARDKLDGEHSNHGQKRHGKEEEMLPERCGLFWRAAAAVREPRDRPPGRESWLSSGKPSRGTSASPTSAMHDQTKSVFERLWGTYAPDGVYEFGQEPERAEP